MNKWNTVHELYSPDEPLTPANCIAKFISDGDSQDFAEAVNKKTWRGTFAIKRTYGSVYVLPKPR